MRCAYRSCENFIRDYPPRSQLTASEFVYRRVIRVPGPGPSEGFLDMRASVCACWKLIPTNRRRYVLRRKGWRSRSKDRHEVRDLWHLFTLPPSSFSSPSAFLSLVFPSPSLFSTSLRFPGVIKSVPENIQNPSRPDLPITPKIDDRLNRDRMRCSAGNYT